MIAPIATISRNTFIESIRQPVFLIVVLIAGLLHTLTTWATNYSMGYRKVPGEVTGDDKLLLDIGLSTVFVCGVLLAAFIATSAISREIENKTILTVVSKPIGRPAVILGKYLGISLAMGIAIYLMLIGLLLGLRHGVLSTAADDPDQPVIVFMLIAVFGSLVIGAVANFMYGWSFSQTSVVTLVPAMTLAYIGVLAINEDWEFQPIGTDLKPQIMLACGAMTVALLVLTAFATAASTRLGQVMTITVCAGVFVLGLLSNHFVGRYAFLNDPIGTIATVESGSISDSSFGAMGSTYTLGFLREYEAEVAPGDILYWGPAPNGVGISTPDYDAAFDADSINPGDTRFPEGAPEAIVVTEIDGLSITVKNVGNPPVRVLAPPSPGDFVFLGPTEINPVALGLWGVIPNMHSFWLIDAVSQARPIPVSHLGLIGLYGLAQIGVALSIAVLLFQGRDVG